MSLQMNNFITPAVYHREYANDLPNKDSVQSELLTQSLRITQVALPFISLYKPVGQPLSVILGATRVVSSLSQMIKAASSVDQSSFGRTALEVAVASTALACSIFTHPLGMLVTTAHDMIINVTELAQAIQDEDYEKATKITLQLANNTLYLGCFFVGSLELSIASIGFQISLGLYNSCDELRKGNYLEGGAHMLMAGIRGKQLYDQAKVLQFKWDLEKVYKSLSEQTVRTAKGHTSYMRDSEKPALIRKLISTENLTDLSVEKIHERALLAIEEGDLDSFSALEKTCDNWKKLSRDDLGELTYCLFESCLHCNEVEKNNVGIPMLKSLVISHPNANTSVQRLTRLLEGASKSGNLAVFEMLQENHPRWHELNSKNLYDVIEKTLSGYNSGVALESRQRCAEGKGDIVSLLIKHKNWDTNSSSLMSRFICLLIDDVGIFYSTSVKLIPDVKVIELVDEALATKGWRDMNASQTADVLSAVRFNSQSQRVYQCCMEHPSWDLLDRWMLTKIACHLSQTQPRSYTGDENQAFVKMDFLNLLTRHARWESLESRDLLKIYLVMHPWGDCNYEFVSELSKHSQWNSFSPKEVAVLIATHQADLRIYELIIQHPNWNNIDKENMVSLAIRMSESSWMLKVISEHPTWKDFTEEDLFEIVRWSYWQDELPQILELLSTHERWINVERRVDDFLWEQEMDDLLEIDSDF